MGQACLLLFTITFLVLAYIDSKAGDAAGTAYKMGLVIFFWTSYIHRDLEEKIKSKEK